MRLPYDVRTHNELTKFITRLILDLKYYTAEPKHFKFLTRSQKQLFIPLLDKVVEKILEFQTQLNVYKLKAPNV